VAIIALKKAEAPFKYEIFDRGFSRFDSQRRNLFLDVPPGVINKTD
jgi:hypothetical protein